MMTDPKILEELTTLFQNVFDDDAIALSRETCAADIPLWDSVAHVTLMVTIEMHFGIKFKAAELEELHNVGELVDLIKAKLLAKR